jgi:hypothetical protein
MRKNPTGPIRSRPKRWRKAALSVSVVLLGVLASATASAGRYHYGKPGVRVGIVIGGPVYGPYWYPGPYYFPRYYPWRYYYPYPPAYYPPPAVTYPPAVITVPGSPPPLYVEKRYSSGAAQSPAPQGPAAQGPEAQAAQQAPTWYYCPSAKGYYPYVRDCPEGWQAVPPHPPPPPQ